MTIHNFISIKCDCCGETFTSTTLRSTSEIGYIDLDTRPAPPKRMALNDFIHMCPNCSYIMQDDKPDADLKEYIQSEEYQTSENKELTGYTSRAYYKNALIQIKKGNFLSATMSFLKAAWGCDDANLSDDATYCRKRFLKCFEEIPDDEINKTIELIRFDVLRRAGEFDTLLKECNPNYFDDPLMADIAKFQILKSRVFAN